MRHIFSLARYRLAARCASRGINKPRLIVLDQFENMLNWDTGHALTDRPGVGEWIDIMNSQPCICRILLTSRPRPVGTREYPPTYMQEYAVGGLEQREGVALLQSQGVQGTGEEMQAAVSHSAGHAFSLTLLASLLRDHHLNLTALFKHTSLWTGDIATNLLDQIYTQKLNDAQRELLLAFSVYREPVPIDATLEIIAETSRTQTPFVLKALVTQHLVEAVGEGRYQLHAIVAGYAQTHFAERNEQTNEEVMRTAHAKAARYYQGQVAKNFPPSEQRRKISDVHDVIEAIYQLCKAEQWEEAYEVMESKSMFDDLRRWGGNAVLLELCLLLEQQDKWSPEPTQLAHIYNSLAWAYNALGRRKRGREYYERSLKIYQGLEDHSGESQVFNALGWSYLVTGQPRKALAYYESALNLCEGQGDRKGEEYNRTCLAWVYNVLGQKRRALEYCRQALSIGKEIGDSWGESRTLNSLGQIYIDLGEYKQALVYLEEALPIRRDAGNRRGQGTTLNHMGRAYRMLGQHELALRHLEQALSIGKEIGDLGLECLAFQNLGLLYLDRGQYEPAQSYLEQSLHISREIEDRRRENRTINALGKVYGILGKDEQAQKCYVQALNIGKEIEDQWGEGTALLNFGTLYLNTVDYDAALACFLLAERLFKMLESPELNEALARLDDLCQKIGEEQFNLLLATVEPRAQEIVDEALHNRLQ